MEANSTPILIFAPGLGRYPENTADAIAEVVARKLDLRDSHATFGTKSDPAVSAPRGVRVAKTIVDGDQKAILQLFELDYMPALELEPRPSLAGPSVVPGILQSASYAVLGAMKWWAALSRPMKTARTKVQLLIGLIAAGSLFFVALAAVWSALVAVGVHVPGHGIFSEDAAAWTFGISSLGLTVTWAAFRRRILSIAATVQRLIRFVRNDDATADSTSMVLDAAIDGLRKQGSNGDIHLLGFSFGSLVLFEAMFPRVTSERDPSPADAVATLVTIGCPLDMVRLYHPQFTFANSREERHPGLLWTNVFNAADIFASNLRDGDDTSSEKGAAFRIGTCEPTSKRYLDEELGWFQIFSSGKTHAGYWGDADRASCFDELLSIWVPAPLPPDPAQKAVPT